MAIYGYDRYGAPTSYGAVFAGSGVDLAPISIRETGYGQAVLTWTAPSADNTYSRIRLVRNSTGFPINETDGVNVREILSSAPSATHLDTGLSQGTHYYYSFFVENDIPLYSTATTYAKGQLAKSSGGTVYVSLTDNNVNNAQTNTTYWAVANVTKRWTLAGQIAILMTTRYDHTTRLYVSLPRYYRSPEPDWFEPTEAEKASQTLAAWPSLAKFLSVFGWALDGIQTRYRSHLDIHHADKTPWWYLFALGNHIGVPVEASVSSRLQRLRLSNAPQLARSRGTKTGVEDDITATLGWDATVTTSVNKMLTWDQADARYPVWPTWDAAGSYAVGDIVSYGTQFYRAILANNGSAQGPPNGGSNTWWTQVSSEVVTTSKQPYIARYGSLAGWVMANRALGTLAEVTGVASPVDSVVGNTYRVTNTSGGAATIEVKIADAFYVRAWAGGTTYLKGELVSYGGSTYEAVVGNAGVTPGTNPGTWRVFLSFVPAGVDPQAIYENAVPVTPSVSWTASAYVVSSNSVASTNILIDWYTSAGAFISTSTGTASALTTSFARRTVTGTAPANAAFAIIRLSAAAVANNGVIEWRSVQIEQSASATTWVPPRRVEALVKPTRVNLATNPSFETNTTGWTAYGTGVTLARTTATFRSGVAAGRITFGTAGTILGGAYFETPVGSVTPGDMWTVSGYMRRGPASRSHRVALRWYTSAGVAIGADVGGQVFVPSDTAYSRFSVIALAPATASYLRVMFGDVAQTYAAGEYVDLDDVLIEKTSVLKSYFDGSSSTLEHFWAGTAHASKSFYYEGHAAKRYRLGDIIKRSIPHGVPYTTRYADV